MIGALAGLGRAGGRADARPGVASILAVAALIVLHRRAATRTALADCADGLGVRADRERRMAVMRDSSIGAFGALALLVWLLLVVRAGRADRNGAFGALPGRRGRGGALGGVAAARGDRPARPGRRAGRRLRREPAGARRGHGLRCAAALGLTTVGQRLAALAAGALAALLVTGWSRAHAAAGRGTRSARAWRSPRPRSSSCCSGFAGR